MFFYVAEMFWMYDKFYTFKVLNYIKAPGNRPI